MVSVKSVSMWYGKCLALDKVSFQAEKGKVLGLLGPNGAGKTTLMRILTGYLYPGAGTASIDGHDIIDNPLAARARIGYMPENIPLYDDMGVDEYLVFMGKARGLSGRKLEERLSWVKETCGIVPVWKHTISEISRGYRQRVGLSQALIHDPSVLILDEPMTGLDPLQIIGIRELVRRTAQDKTIIFSTHILQEVEALADSIVILNNGRIIAQGAKKEIVQMATTGEKVTLVVKAKKEAVEAVLAKENIISELCFEGTVEEGCVKFLIAGLPDKRLAATIKGIVERENWPLKELRGEDLTLEEAFIWLLREDKKEHRL